MVQHSLEEGVGEQAAAAVEGGEVPHDAAAIAAGCHTLLPAAGFHSDACHCTFVLLHAMQWLTRRTTISSHIFACSAILYFMQMKSNADCKQRKDIPDSCANLRGAASSLKCIRSCDAFV